MEILLFLGFQPVTTADPAQMRDGYRVILLTMLCLNWA
ncbi:hypothetical protein GFS31_41840 (plasmid) [Leptolyngbya sp. BL0902]|nr:hypothetical protein GFS31_41840 [Leptolyngbya sp. BL0902]